MKRNRVLFDVGTEILCIIRVNGSTERSNLVNTWLQALNQNLLRACNFSGKFNQTYMPNTTARGVRRGAPDHLLGLRVRIPLKIRTQSLVNMLRYQLTASATGRSLVKSNPIDCACVCVCVCACLSLSRNKEGKNVIIFRNLLRYKDWPKIGYCSYFCYKFDIFNSNKSPTRRKNFPVYYPNVYLQLNIFRASSRPSSGAQ